MSTIVKSVLVKELQLLGEEAEKQDILMRLAVIGIKTLKEDRGLLDIQTILESSENAATQLHHQTTPLRKEIVQIKQQLSRLTTKFYSLPEEEDLQQQQQFLDNRSNHLRQVQPSERNDSKKRISNERLEQNSKNLKGIPQNARDNSSESINTIQQNQQRISRKPSSAWRTGDKCNSSNPNQNSFDDCTGNTSVDSQIPNKKQIQLQEKQAPNYDSSNSQISQVPLALKVTETPYTKPEVTKTATKHHLNDYDTRNENDQQDQDIKIPQRTSSNEYSQIPKQIVDEQQENKKYSPQQIKQQVTATVRTNSDNIKRKQRQQEISAQLQQQQQQLQQWQQQQLQFQNQDTFSVQDKTRNTSEFTSITSPKYKELNNKYSHNSVQSSAQYLPLQQQQQQINYKNANIPHNINYHSQIHNYGTTRSVQIRQEMNQQKRQREILSREKAKRQMKQPQYLKGVTSKIRDDIKQKREANKGIKKQDVLFILKEPHCPQKQLLTGTQLFRQEYQEQQQQIYRDQYEMEEQQMEQDVNPEYLKVGNRHRDGNIHKNNYIPQQQDDIDNYDHNENDSNNDENEDTSNYIPDHKYNFSLNNNHNGRHQIIGEHQQQQQQYQNQYNEIGRAGLEYDYNNNNIDSKSHYLPSHYVSKPTSADNQQQYSRKDSQTQYLNNNSNNSNNSNSNLIKLNKSNLSSGNNIVNHSNKKLSQRESENIEASQPQSQQYYKNQYNYNNNNNNNNNNNYSNQNEMHQMEQNEEEEEERVEEEYDDADNNGESIYHGHDRISINDDNDASNYEQQYQEEQDYETNDREYPLPPDNEHSNMQRQSKVKHGMEQQQLSYIQRGQQSYQNSSPSKSHQSETDLSIFSRNYNQPNQSHTPMNPFDERFTKEQPSIRHSFTKNSSIDHQAEREDSSMSSSFAPFEPDQDMKLLLQKDGFFQKIFEQEDCEMSERRLADGKRQKYENS